ncbi:MAG: hypothetical protein AMXMBFR47_33410 [Planctomycetota bacterium]
MPAMSGINALKPAPRVPMVSEVYAAAGPLSAPNANAATSRSGDMLKPRCDRGFAAAIPSPGL